VHPEAQLVETAGGTTMVKLTTSYNAAFGEYLKVCAQCCMRVRCCVCAFTACVLRA
jgi:hypothetical protein